MTTMRTIATGNLYTLAYELVSTDIDAPALECSICGRTTETYADEWSPADAVARRISDFLSHCAYDHGEPADINRLVPVARRRLKGYIKISETHDRDTAKDKKAAQRNEPSSGANGATGGAAGGMHGIDEWLELIESQVAARLNAKAGRTVYNTSGANVETHSLDCAHCLTDYAH